MKRRIKKPPVKPEKAEEWLKRYERDGETIAHIATADGFDARTVRKQIEIARLSREMREARHSVLRSAVEKHYGDICDFAQRLRAELSGDVPTPVSSMFKEDPIWLALKEHLPRLRLWKDIDRWENLAPEFEKTINVLKERIKVEASSRSSLTFTDKNKEVGLYDGFMTCLLFHLRSAAMDRQGLNGIDFKEVDAEDGIRLERGVHALALVPRRKVKDVETLFDSLMDEATKWEEYDELSKLSREFIRTKTAIQEELTKIILKRFVPGKCTYCPF